MFTIEDYIAKRKQEDNLNEFDKNKKIDNIKSCIDYIFEYYNNYLEINEINERTVLNNEKVKKFRKYLIDYNYNEEVKEWLVYIFDKYENNMNIIIRHIIEKNNLFMLYYTEAEFRKQSYECYSKLVNKYTYLKSEIEMIFKYVKEYHRDISSKEINIPNFSDKMTKWILHTKESYGVNIVSFINQYMWNFWDEEEKWPRTHKIKVKSTYNDGWEYEYNYKKKSNLFNLDLLYAKISDRPFIKGKKQYLEVLMMYYFINGEDDEYLQEYLNSVFGEN